MPKRRVERSRWAAAAAWLALAPTPLWADSFRCGTFLIREGLPMAEIRAKCGKPEAVDTVTEPIMARHADGTLFQVGIATREYWRYDRGSNRLPARITVEDGIAKNIELLSRN